MKKLTILFGVALLIAAAFTGISCSNADKKNASNEKVQLKWAVKASEAE